MTTEEKAKYNREYYLANKEAKKEASARYHEANKERLNAQSRERYRKNRAKRLEQSRVQSNTVPGRYSRYKTSAKKRNLAFTLSLEEFGAYWQQPCIYCGDSISTIGLDRVDNERGYEPDNVVPCCTGCNYSKRDGTTESYIARCKRVAALH